MSRNTSLSLLIAIPLIGSSISSQSGAYTPRPGSAERKAIMDVARVPVEAELKKKVVFKVDHLKVKAGWAFMEGVPLGPDGKLAYRGTKYEQWWKEGSASDLVGVLLRKQAEKWKVVDYVIGPSDVAWESWDRKYKAPSEIFKD